MANRPASKAPPSAAASKGSARAEGSSTKSAVLGTYARQNITFVRGQGSYLFAEDGQGYLDFGSGIAVNVVGHAHPHLVEALKAQADKLWHTSNLYQMPEQERLARRLADATFADVAFFANSGAEANECAIKMARRYQHSKGHPERYRVLTVEGAFHGRTLATIAAGGQAKHLEGFGPKVDGFDQVAFGDHAALEAAVGPQTAAILLEPVQGEGGIRPITMQCLKGARELCDKHGLLLIFDEIQCGMGRTGRLFAHEWAGITPDIMTVAKAIGGGFPLGICLATAEAASGMTPGSHGTTFGGNPLATAVGNAVLDVVLADGFVEGVNRKALVMRQYLAELQDEFPEVIEEVRGQGLMLGLKLRVPVAQFMSQALDAGILVVGAGDNTARILPPLTVSEEELAEGKRRLEKACRSAAEIARAA